MRRPSVLPLFTFLTLLGAVAAQSATFDAGSSAGWGSVTLGYPSAGAPPLEIAPAPVTPQVFAGGGNPGGYIGVTDPDGTLPNGNTQYWKAPASFLGNRADRIGGVLSFDVRATTNLTAFDQDDVLLTGGGVTIAWFAAVRPVPNVWTRFTAPLSVGQWHVGDRSGPLATQAELAMVLGALESMYLRGEFQLGPDVMGLDNVAFAAAAAAQPFGAGCGAPGYPAPALTALGVPAFGGVVTLQATCATASGVGVFVHSTASLPGIDLTGIGMPGCLLYVPLDVLTAAVITGGTMQDSLAIPNQPTLTGVHLYSQSAVFAPVNALGLVTSNAVDGTLGS